jgi:hypothetical protein
MQGILCMKHKKLRKLGADDAFISSDWKIAKDDFAELVGEQYISSAISGEEAGEETLARFVHEQTRGSFVYTQD